MCEIKARKKREERGQRAGCVRGHGGMRQVRRGRKKSAAFIIICTEGKESARKMSLWQK